MKSSFIKPFTLGILASLILLSIYFTILTLVSGWNFTLKQFNQFWHFVVSLAIGFGIQVGLYIYLKTLQRNTRGVVAVSGTTSTIAMISCCSHYVANLVPILGIAGALTIIGQYQIQLFWVGLVTNFLGILYMTHKILQLKKTTL